MHYSKNDPRSRRVIDGPRDPSSHRTPAQIRTMDENYNHRPEIIHQRSMRNQARSYMRKKLGEGAIKGRDIDHKKMVSKGGTNDPSNLRVRSVHTNRGWERDA